MTTIYIEVIVLAVLYGIMGVLRINPGRFALLLLSIFLLGVGWVSIVLQ